MCGFGEVKKCVEKDFSVRKVVVVVVDGIFGVEVFLSGMKGILNMMGTSMWINRVKKDYELI